MALRDHRLSFLFPFAIVVLGCAADPPSGSDACDGADCNLPGAPDLLRPDGPCLLRRCDAGGRTRCGKIDDGCGGTLDCGGCTAPQTCGGGGLPDECGCTGELEADFCAARGASCGSVSGLDRCMKQRIAFCGDCMAPESCGGGGKDNACGCTPEADAVLCARLGKNCGAIAGTDQCGKARMVDCGSCVGLDRCGGSGVPNTCGCDETDTEFCARLGKNCGTVIDRDRCERPRQVMCGTCMAPATCGGGGLGSVCGCTPEDDRSLCLLRGAECDLVMVMDRCGTMRTPKCGDCAPPKTCGGAGLPNRCGCTPEDDAALCLSVMASCGPVSVVDRCGAVRTPDCGPCAPPKTCGGGGVRNVCGCMPERDALLCARAGFDCGTAPLTDNCGSLRDADCGACDPYSTCGGGGKANVCGCTPESDGAYCARYNATCGTVSRPDNCGNFRTVVCGTCQLGNLCAANFTCTPEPAAPQLIAPSANSYVTTHRPTLQFKLGPGTDTARIQICLDRNCVAVLAAIDGAGSVVPPKALAPGRYFFRGLGIQKGLVAVTVTSPAWPFWVRRADTPVDTAWGAVPDLDNDGRADVFSEAAQSTIYDRSWVGYFAFPAAATALSCTDSTCGRGLGSGDLDGNGYADALFGDGSRFLAVVFNGARAKGTPATLRLETALPPTYGPTAVLTGDLDGDGYSDLALTGASTIAIYPGALNGPDTLPLQVLGPPELGDAAFPIGLAVVDVNGDRYADLVSASSTASLNAGRVYFYAGGPRGAPAQPTATLSCPTPGRSMFGSNLAAAGDVNGDGYGDVIATDNGLLGRERETQPNVYVLYGSAQGLTTQGATVIVSKDRVVNLDALRYTNYGGAIAGVGDVDADGFDDIAIGAPAVESGTGEVYVHHGAANGVNPIYARLLLGPINWNERFGATLAGFDYDGDGFSDLIVSAPSHQVNTPNGLRPYGRIYWYKGTAQGIGAFSAGVFDNAFSHTLSFGQYLGRVQ